MLRVAIERQTVVTCQYCCFLPVAIHRLRIQLRLVVKAPLVTAKALLGLRTGSVNLCVCLSVRPSVCLSVTKTRIQKRDFLKN